MNRVVASLMLFTFLPAALAASDTTTMEVSLNNVASVSVQTTPINFGDVGTADNFVNAQGTIRVNASNGLPYNIAIDSGLSPAASGVCRVMTGDVGVQRRYELFTAPTLFTRWGDGDFDNTCSGTTSKPDIGDGTEQVHVVHARASAGDSIGRMSDTLTVTVYY